MVKLFRFALCLAAVACVALSAQAQGKKKIVLVAGTPSHGPGDHEHNAGMLLLKKCLDGVAGVDAVVFTNGWPKTENPFAGADAIVLYSDGGPGHMALQGNHLAQLDEAMKRGAGLACLHYAVEVQTNGGGPEFLKWIGGYFEAYWSINPTWEADFASLPDHPITRGVKPFKIRDEWYYHMRFQPDHVTPILSAVPTADAYRGSDAAHSGDQKILQSRKGQPESVAWAYDRPDGGRGFGFCGGHYHKNWGDENVRRVVLNAILWIAKIEVPAGGVMSTVSADDLAKNLDPKGQRPAPRRNAGGTEHASGPEAAQEAMSKFTVAPGLEVKLFASEPMVRNPTDMDIDAKGRVWITEGVNYRSSFQSWGVLQPGGDRIVILESTKGDGVADKQTVFYQGPEINAALGICVLGNKVIVSRSPDIFVLTDTKGVGKADKVEKLFTGISGVDHDHGAHAFVFGPDGKFYFNFGNEGKQLKDKDGKPVLDPDGIEINNHGQPYRMGMVFRCNPDGSEVEVLAHNFRNNYEVAVDSYGNLWQSDNDDDGNRGVRINFVMEGGNYGYSDEMTGAGWQAKRSNIETDIPHRHWHQNDPGVVPNLLFTGGGSPTGMAFYEGGLLPEVFRNAMIHCDAGPRVVRAYPTTPDGAGYSAKTVDILTSTDNWFRPSDVCVAPDGSLYVADWNDAGVGGHNMADRDLAKMTGRVYRIAPPNDQPAIRAVDYTAPLSAIRGLQSPNLATRYLAWTALHDMQAKAEPALLLLWNKENQSERARALWLLADIKGSESKYINLALADKNPDIRITGLRIAREHKLDVIGAVKKLVQDPSAQVRRECAIALRHNHSPEAPALWTQLARQHDGKDRWYLEALGIGADKQDDAYFAAWLAAVGDQWNTPAGRDIVWRLRSTKAPALLVKILKDPATPEAEKPRYLRSFDFLKGAEKDAALVELLDVAAPVK